MVTGQCECGSIKFKVEKVRPSVTICHCSQCRRTSGHLWASTHAEFDAVEFSSTDSLVWYASSGQAQRGFCSLCGSSLFYRMNDETGIGIAAGCLDNTDGLHVVKHIFVEDKGSYYEALDDQNAHAST